MRYQETALRPDVAANEVLTVNLRYKRPDESESRLLTRTLATPAANAPEPSGSFRFAAAVAEFGLLLRDSEYKGDADYDFVYERAREALGTDEDGRRSELLSLIRTADSLTSIRIAVDSLEPERPRAIQLASGQTVRLQVRDYRDAVYAIEAEARSGGFDPVLSLYRQYGNRIATIASDDDGGANLNSRLVVRLDATETYFIEVREYAGLAGYVTLSVTEH